MKPFSIQHSAFSILPKAFSLVEIMFAVMILGIGFIMIAGMFPVAIQQSQATVAETTGTIVAEGAARVLKASPKTWLDAGLTANWGPMGMGSQQISASDPKFGFIGFKRLQTAGISATYQVLTIAVEAKNVSEFPPASFNFELDAMSHAAAFAINVHTVDPSVITFAAGAARLEAVEGAHVLISQGALLGTVLVVGAPVDAANGIWGLFPGPAIGAEGAVLPGLNGFIVGRGLRNPVMAWDNIIASPTYNPYEGPSIAVHASEIRTVIK